MTLTFKFFGVEVARLRLDIEQTPPAQVTTLDRGIKKMSGWWVGRMNR